MSQSYYTKNADLDAVNVRNRIFKYLHENVNTEVSLVNINSTKDLDTIRDGEYIVCPRLEGTRSWILFFKSNDVYYAVNFPKHNIRKQTDCVIHPINMNISKNLYYGTIMEGIYFSVGPKKCLVVDEVYILAGEDQLSKSKDDRLIDLSNIIPKSIIHNPNYHFSVSQFYQTDKKSLKDLYEKIKSDDRIQDLIFYPKIYGKKIFSYTIIESDLIDHIIKLSVFYLLRTDNIDVYKLLTIPNKEKIGLAYIPDIETSKKCRQWFKDNKNKKRLKVKCRMDMSKNKWIPFELIENDIDEKLLDE